MSQQKKYTILIIAGCILGFIFGLSGYTFIYAKGYSYLQDESANCANCHVMADHLSGWQNSPHRNAASCNDCHTPRGSVSKYMAKAASGMSHSTAFTSGAFTYPIQISKSGKEIVENSCKSCHASTHDDTKSSQGSLSCLSCHRNPGH